MREYTCSSQQSIRYIPGTFMTLFPFTSSYRTGLQPWLWTLRYSSSDTVFVSNQLNSLQMLSSDTTRQGLSRPPGNFQAGYQGEFPGCKVIMSRIHRRSGLQFFLQRTLKLSMDIQNVLRLMSHYSPAPQNSKPCIQHHLGMISLSTHNKPLRYGFIGPFFR